MKYARITIVCITIMVAMQREGSASDTGLITFLTVTGAARAGTPAEDRMSVIVRNVRANEELYKNREIFGVYSTVTGRGL